MNSTLKSLLFWMVLVVVGVLIWNVSTKLQQNEQQVRFSDFMASAEAGKIQSVVITGQEVTGVNTDNEPFRTYAPEQYEGLVNKLIERGVVVQANVEDTRLEVQEYAIDKLGVKAVAIYRDNCKVGQPLATAKKDDNSAEVAAAVVEPIERIVEKIIHKPIREKLPRSRSSRTFDFRVADSKGLVTVAEYADGRPGELFIRVSKQGSTLAGVMDAFSISISIALQYGVPLEAFVAKFTNMRFEPAGLTDDADIRMAQSVMDYIFRRLALDYLPYEKRAALGIFTAEERAAQVAGYDSTPAITSAVEDDVDAVVETLSQSAPVSITSSVAAAVSVEPVQVHSSAELMEAITGKTSDAPLCMTCGIKMRPAGACYACEGCGATSGCS